MTTSRWRILQQALPLLAVCVVIFSSAQLQAASPGRPNVLMIAVDDLNDWVGPLGGHPQAQTPAMDRLAARGTTFTNAHCQSPLCNPSRTSLMTGLRPSTTGVYGLAPWFRSVPELKDLTTLPQHFRRHGYRTYTTGKIYHGGYPPREQRAAEYDVWGPDASVGARPAEKLVETPHGNHPLVDWGTFPHADQDKGDWQVASWAVEQIEAMPEDEPFFLSVGFFLPHVPCYATQPWFDLYPDATLQMPPILRGDRDDTPPFSWYLHWELPEPRLRWLREANQWRPLVRSYLATVSFVDSQIGRVLDALDKSGHADDTIVVLWSDHGFHLGEKEISGKNTLWDDGTRVPLIFAGPGVVSGARCNRPAELLDIYPTLSELCGMPVREELEGISMAAQLADPAAPRERPAITTHNPDNHGVRSERWRYIRYADGSEELYDTQADPNEWHNLASDAAFDAVVSEHRRWLPASSLPPVPGSAHRILVREGDQWLWEGEPIDEVSFSTPKTWEYSAPLISPVVRPAEQSHAQKDPTVVFHDGRWHVFMTVKLPTRSAIEYCSFERWEDADQSERTILEISDSDYYCAPQVFYFEPHDKWYLVYQMGVPGADKMWVAYSTTSDIADPASWTRAQPMLDGGEDDPRTVGGLDYWIICDSERAYLFYTSLDGRMWRLWTPVESFPQGFDHCELALQAEIFEASHTYRLKGLDKYLTIVEEDGRRYYKAYLADRLDGPWTPVADTAEHPFAGWNNIRPAAGVQPWTDNVSHGELIRDGRDQTLTVDPNNLRFAFQGMFDRDKSSKSYDRFQWRIGILTPVE